jgi:hypothetical protein
MASYGERLLVFEARPDVRVGSVLHNATFHVDAHSGSVITQLLRGGSGNGENGGAETDLFSGAQNGSIHR